MSNTVCTAGIDVCGKTCYVARVENMTGRPQIKALARFSRERLAGHQLLTKCRRVFSVSEDQALIKRLTVGRSDHHRFEDLACFELGQSMLEPTDDFELTVAVRDSSESFLGFAIRREQLAEIGHLTADDDQSPPPEFLVRVQALARGVRTFCRSGGGQMEIYADLSTTLASIAFVHRDNLVDAAWLKLVPSHDDNTAVYHRLASELCTVVNFRLADLAQQGLSAPPAKLVLSGEKGSPQVHKALAEVFSYPVVTPEISAGFFPDQVDVDRLPLSLYMVALGLAGGS